MFQIFLCVIMMLENPSELNLSLVSLQLSEKSIDGFDHDLKISYEKIQVEGSSVKYQLIIVSNSCGWTLSKKLKVSAESVNKLSKLMLDDGLLYLPPLNVDVFDRGVRRDLRAKLFIDGKLRDISIHAYGSTDTYDFASESNQWKKWILLAKNKDTRSGPVPLWVYNRLFQRIYSEVFMLLPMKTMEEFCRKGV